MRPRDSKNKGWQVTLIFLGALALAACSTKGDGEPDNASAFCRDWGTAACTEFAMEQCSSPDRETCVEYQQQDCEERLDADRYSKQGAQPCLDAVKRAYDDAKLTGSEFATVFEFAGACSKILSSEVSAGSSCNVDADCNVAKGFACVLRPVDGELEGECHIPLEVGGGETCDDAEQTCSASFYCDGRHCVARPELGDSCSEIEPCDTGLRCVVDRSGDGTCEEKLGLRQACETNDECASALCTESGDNSRGCATSILLDFNKRICDAFGPLVRDRDPEPEVDAGDGKSTADAGR